MVEIIVGGVLAAAAVAYVLRPIFRPPAGPGERFCAACGAAVGAGAAFCARCGEALGDPAEACAECGAALTAGARFCARCGTGVPS